MVCKRFDFGELDRFDGVDDAGMLRAGARMTRAGVFQYRRRDGSIRRELRHPDDVFRADSLATLAQVPLTLGHPPDMLTSETASRYQVGMTGERVDVEDNVFVRSRIAVTDGKAVQAVQRGDARQVSCGYTCGMDETPGVWNGERYDARQTDIRYNHAALVPAGRAGPQVRVMDGADVNDDVGVQVDDVGRMDGGNVNGKIRIDGVEVELPVSVAQAVQAKFDAMTAELDTVKRERDTAQAAADNAPKADQIRADAIADVRSRIALETQAAEVLGTDGIAKFDGKPDRDLRVAVIGKLEPTQKLDGKSDDYVAARFDGVLETFRASKSRVRGASAALVTGAVGTGERNDGADADEWSKTQAELQKRLDAAGTPAAW
jgi:uncharacterized protein